MLLVLAVGTYFSYKDSGDGEGRPEGELEIEEVNTQCLTTNSTGDEA
jgi:hypothetical protein